MTELVLDTALSSHQRDYLATVKDSGESLLAVINDILDFSRIEAGRLVLDQAPFDLREVLGDTMKSLALRAHKQGLELACHIAPDVPGFVVGDPGRVRQIVINLVGNAIKFTEQGEVVLDASVDSRGEQQAMLHFSVRDTGIGIPEEKQEAIFHPFEQVDGTLTRRHAGSGLGLAICSRLVEQMGGRMWLSSRLGHGSTFHFSAPFGLAPGAPDRGPRADPGSIQGTRVLAVDDNATNRRILEEMLASWGMRPAMASGAREALQRMREAQRAGTPFRLVVSDTHMPEMDGFTLAEEIARDPEISGTVVIMLSPLLSDQSVATTLVLARRGLGVVAVDTLAEGARPGDDDARARLAWRMRLLEREEVLRRMQHVGIPVVAWQGPGTLDEVLRKLGRRASMPRMATR